MSERAVDIAPDEYLDIRLDIENIERKEGTVAYYATCVAPNGTQVMLTVFRNNLPEVEIRAGETYEFSDVKGEEWEDGTPAVKFTGQSTVRRAGSAANWPPLSQDKPREVERGYDIDEGDLVSIELLVKEFEPVGENRIAYRAWCGDQYGDLVIFTAFESTRPDANLEAGKRYEFSSVVGERWEDGTPGIKSADSTSIQPVKTQNASTQPAATMEESRELMINAVDEKQFAGYGDEGGMLAMLTPGFGVAVSGAVTGVGILASVFAGDIGLWTKLLFVGGGTIFAALVAYATQYEPASRLQTRRKRKHTRVFLKILLQDYLALVGDGSEVRANLMTPTSDGLLEQDSLRIFSAVGGYEESEREAAYIPMGNQGPWARAFDNKEIAPYDRESRHESVADLDAGQRKIIERVRSSVSVPIYTDTGVHRKPIGVLTLDSRSPIEDTRFTKKEVQTLLRRYSTLLGEVLE